jgi:hypothetical protein
MFADVDLTLKAMLTATAAPPTLRNADISFEAPDKDYKPTQLTLNLFLHDVSENRELRDPVRTLTSTKNGYRSAAPPLRIECNYLITAWSTKTAAAKAAEEHQLLALALTWLARFSVIGASFLVGGLANPPQPFPVTTTIAERREGENRGHFWSALGITPRACFGFDVTVALRPFQEVEVLPRVEPVSADDLTPRVSVDYGLLAEPELRGRVLDPSLAAVAGATVLDVASGASVTTDVNGAFSFPGIAFGDHELRVQAAGHPTFDRTVSYARESQVHNMILLGP